MEQTWIALLVLSAAASSVVAEGGWGYEENNGPSTWPDHYKDCGKNMQSPISLSMWDVYFSDRKHCACSFTFGNYGRLFNTTLTNNGHTANMQFPNSSSSSPYVIVKGCGRDGKYSLQNCHWHWPSEHEVNGKRGKLEMHCVHNNGNNQNLVLGFLFDLCWESENRWGKVTSALEKVTNPGNSVSITNFRPDSLLPTGGSFYVYKGSLTTPPCTENVLWLVYARHLCISEETLKMFHNIRNEEGESMTGNNRPLQDRNGRTVCLVSQEQ